MFTKSFLVSLVEQVGIAAVGAFSATLAATTGSVDKAVLVAALAAAVRGAYGVLVSKFGSSGTASLK